MKNNITYTSKNYEPKAPDELLKTTALLYFKEALLNQEFEHCPELLKTAKRYGARQAEITNVINEVQNRSKTGRKRKSDAKIGGRLGFIKGE